MKTRQLKEAGMDCAECGQHVEPAGAFHPFLYCLLYKVGVRNQAEFLRDSGFVRESQRAASGPVEKEAQQ